MLLTIVKRLLVFLLLRPVVCLFALFWFTGLLSQNNKSCTITVVLAYPFGAGHCSSGTAIANLSHGTTGRGSLRNGNYQIRLVTSTSGTTSTTSSSSSITLVPGPPAFLYTQTEYKITLAVRDGISDVFFRGFLLRLSGKEGEDVKEYMAMSPEYSTGALGGGKNHTMCSATVAGVTHTDASDKTSVDAILLFKEPIAQARLEVTVVQRNSNPSGSNLWYYDSYDIVVSQAPPPTNGPTSWHHPSASPSVTPQMYPSYLPSTLPSQQHGPSVHPTSALSNVPTLNPSDHPSLGPSWNPSSVPSLVGRPSVTPSSTPSLQPSVSPSSTPSFQPSVTVSSSPSVTLSSTPSIVPPTEYPSSTPSRLGPTAIPSANSTDIVLSAMPTIETISAGAHLLVSRMCGTLLATVSVVYLILK